MFRIVPGCNRAAAKSINGQIDPLLIETRVPTQPAPRSDISSQELIDAINALLID